MKRFISYSFVFLISFLGIFGSALGATVDSDNHNSLYIYKVNKTVADFPERQDFSTPEAAYVVVNRAIASGNQAVWRRISASRIINDLPPLDTKKIEVKPEKANAYLSARIVEVRIFRGVYAGVITELAFNSYRFDSRRFELENGKWLNIGENMSESLEDARESFAKSCLGYTKRPVRPRISEPNVYLKPFVEFLKTNGKEPKEFVMNALVKRRITIMGEIHHRPRYWIFNSSLVNDPAFSKAVGTIFMELPSNDQALVDKFLAAKELDVTPVIEMLRDMLWTGWPDQSMLDFFVTVWKVNQNLLPVHRIRIVLVDMQRPWKDIEERKDWRKYDTNRDKLMADNILRYLNEYPQEKRNALFIVGVGHVMLNLKYPDQTTPMRSTGWYLRQKLGTENVYGIFPHEAVETNWGEVRGLLCLGLFDSAFAVLNNKPLAFSLDSGPFGKQPFDAFSDKPAFGTYRDGYNAYLYLGPLENETFSALIPGFYTEEFVNELDRRYRLTEGKGLVESQVIATLDAKSFIDWMSKTWGQPRLTWKYILGPKNAWKYGDNWEKEIREEQHNYAITHPEIIADAARKLFEIIRTSDYGHPETLWSIGELDYYCVQQQFDVWIDWICKKFKNNTIESVELGKVSIDEQKRPTIVYKLTLENGETLEGVLPFEYQPQFQHWQGFTGLDWHLKNK